MTNARSPIAAYADRRIAVILGIGLASGLPFILVTDTMAAWMSDVGSDVKQIGLFGLVTLPWSIKFLWSPLVDRFRPPVPGMGRRRSWLLVTQLLLAAILPAMALLGPADAKSPLMMLAIVSVLAATVSATQDIVASAYMIDSLEARRLGAGAAMYVTGYRLASVVGGAAVLMLADDIGWRLSFAIVGGLMLIGVLATAFAPEPREGAVGPRSIAEALIEPVNAFARRLGWIAILLLLFAVLFRLPDQLAGRMTMPLLIQELKFTAGDVGAIRQLLGMIVTIAGAIAGGAIVARLGLIKSLLLFGLLQAISNAGFWALAANADRIASATIAATGADDSVWTLVATNSGYRWMAAVISIEGFCGGLVSAGFVAFLMSCCDTKFSATQYAVLTGLMGFAGSLGPAWTGHLVEDVGYARFFLITIVAGLPGIALIPWMRRATRAPEYAGPGPSATP